MALQPEIWEADIVGNLFKGNEFLEHSTNADQYVTGGRAVHIPNANQPSNVVKNRTNLPASITKRTDTDVVYLLDELTSDPIVIPNIDTIQLSYDKRASALQENQSKIKQVGADEMLYNWGGTTSNILLTSGTAAKTTLSGATGNRKLFRKEDLLEMQTLFDTQDVPADGRVALLSPQFVKVLMGDKELTQNFQMTADLAKGIIGELYGFKLMKRSSVLRFDNSGTPLVKAPGDAMAADDNASALCWHPFAVERALGQVKMFEQLNHPQFYGDVYSFLLMLGGRVRRGDGKGIGAIVEAASA
jgi:hypothetical protein